MELRIVTNGEADDTLVYLNGKLQDSLSEINFTARAGHKCKMQVVYAERDGKGYVYSKPMSFYGGDFEKFDKPERANSGVIGQNNQTAKGKT